MTFRFLTFAGAQFLAVLAGWSLGDALGGLVALLLGTWLWFLLDLWRGLRVRRWLRKGQLADAPAMGGLWGEVADRARRMLRQLVKKAEDSEARLQEFLLAIQASPNGVVLLDPEGHIEWCNQTAAQHFGFDPDRDLMQSIGNLLREPVFAAYYASRDYSHDIVMNGRGSTLSRPVRLSVHLHGYGEGRRLLLSRDITALDQADAMRRDFVADVAHEIRTPLTVLWGFIYTMHYLFLGILQAIGMQTVVSDLLTLSRLGCSPVSFLPECVGVQWLLMHCEQE